MNQLTICGKLPALKHAIPCNHIYCVSQLKRIDQYGHTTSNEINAAYHTGSRRLIGGMVNSKMVNL